MFPSARLRALRRRMRAIIVSINISPSIIASIKSNSITHINMGININADDDSRRGLRRRSQPRRDMQMGLPRVRLPTREGGAAIRTMWAWVAASCKLEC